MPTIYHSLWLFSQCHSNPVSLYVTFDDARGIQLAYDNYDEPRRIYTIPCVLHGKETVARVDLSQVMVMMLEPVQYVLDKYNNMMVAKEENEND